MVAHRELDEAVIVSTCNRTELFAVSSSHDSAAERLFAFLRHEVGDGTLTPERTFEVRDAEVARHLFRVSASLGKPVRIAGDKGRGIRRTIASPGQFSRPGQCRSTRLARLQIGTAILGFIGFGEIITQPTN